MSGLDDLLRRVRAAARAEVDAAEMRAHFDREQRLFEEQAKRYEEFTREIVEAVLKEVRK